MQRTKCQECRKTYYCVVVQGMRWCFCFVSCHKWSILDVLFPVKTIESCSSGASTSGVDIFRGGGLYLFYNLFHSCENLCGRKPECVRAEEGFLRCCELCLHASAPVWHLMRTQTFNSTLRLSISVLLWWSVIKRATRSRTFLHSGTHFFLESRIFSILCPPPPPHFLLQLLFKLSVYVKDWAADCSIDLQAGVCRAGLSSISTATLRDCTLFTDRGGKGESNFVFSVHVLIRSQNQSTRAGVSPDDNNARAVFWHVHSYCGSLSNSFCQKRFFLPLVQKRRLDPKAVVWGLCVQ